MRTWKILAFTTISSLAASAAQAQTVAPAADEPRSAPAEQETDSFGGQIVLADALAIAAGIGAGEATQSAYPFLAFWSLSAPTVHLAHGDGTGFAASLALHVLAPVAGAYIGVQLSNCSSTDDFCGLGGAAVGLLIGAVVATTVDAAVLAKIPRAQPIAATQRSRFLAMPSVAVDPATGGFVLGLSGRL